MTTLNTSAPYLVTIGFAHIDRFASFVDAVRCYASIDGGDKSLVNVATKADDTSGLTDAELDTIYSLPMTREATEAEVARALKEYETAMAFEVVS